MTSLQTISMNQHEKRLIAALEKDSGLVISDALNKAELKALKAETAALLNDTPYCDGIFHGYSTKRIGGMIGKLELCQKMAAHPKILAVMDHFLLPNCSDYQINLSQLISIGPGERQQVIHADDPMFPFEHDYEIMLNVMWAIDDFTIENGATHIAPGSHLWERDREPFDHEVIQAEAKAGSCIIWLGSARHGGGANNTQLPRTGIVISYCLGWLRQSENQYLAIPKETVQTFPARLQELCGYFVHKPNLGMVDGSHPLLTLNPNNQNEIKSFQDFMPDDIQELLDKHYTGEKVAVA